MYKTKQQRIDHARAIILSARIAFRQRLQDGASIGGAQLPLFLCDCIEAGLNGLDVDADKFWNGFGSITPENRHEEHFSDKPVKLEVASS